MECFFVLRRCGGGNRTHYLKVMLTTTAFATPPAGGFVVWTFPSPSSINVSAPAIKSLHLPSLKLRQGNAFQNNIKGLARDYPVIITRASPNLTSFTREFLRAQPVAKLIPTRRDIKMNAACVDVYQLQPYEYRLHS